MALGRLDVRGEGARQFHLLQHKGVADACQAVVGSQQAAALQLPGIPT